MSAPREKRTKERWETEEKPTVDAGLIKETHQLLDKFFKVGEPMFPHPLSAETTKGSPMKLRQPPQEPKPVLSDLKKAA
jgi:hypothetical protein